LWTGPILRDLGPARKPAKGARLCVLQVQAPRQPVTGRRANCCGIATAMNFKALLKFYALGSSDKVVNLEQQCTVLTYPCAKRSLAMESARAVALKLALDLAKELGTPPPPQWARDVGM
jgi:hypothetical protein